MNKLLKYHGLTILWALFIFVLCTVNLGTITQSPLFFPGFDKLVHCGLFFVLVMLYGNGYLRQHTGTNFSYKLALIVFLTAVLYGFIIELLQLTVFTWRDFEWNDLFADSVGAGMATFGVLLINSAGYAKE